MRSRAAWTHSGSRSLSRLPTCQRQGRGGDQRADLGDVAVGQEVRDHLAAGPTGGGQALLAGSSAPGDHRDLDPRVKGSGEHGHPASVGEPDAADSPRIDRRVCGNEVERPEDIAEVLGHQQPAKELHADEGGSAGVAPRRLGLGRFAAAEGGQARSSHHVAEADELETIVVVQPRQPPHGTRACRRARRSRRGRSRRGRGSPVRRAGGRGLPA